MHALSGQPVTEQVADNGQKRKETRYNRKSPASAHDLVAVGVSGINKQRRADTDKEPRQRCTDGAEGREGCPLSGICRDRRCHGTVGDVD